MGKHVHVDRPDTSLRGQLSAMNGFDEAVPSSIPEADQFDKWLSVYEQQPDIFKPEIKVVPQGQDGQAHFSYFDYSRQLSFIWDGEFDEAVTVACGGHGEPAKWSFEYYQMYHAWYISNGWDANTQVGPTVRNFAEAIMQFQKICDFWIHTKEMEYGF